MTKQDELYEMYLDNADIAASTGNSKTTLMWVKMARQLKPVSKRLEDDLIEQASKNAIFAKANRLVL
jgi:hypothetical protein